jgi:hypothetical protein
MSKPLKKMVVILGLLPHPFKVGSCPVSEILRPVGDLRYASRIPDAPATI